MGETGESELELGEPSPILQEGSSLSRVRKQNAEVYHSIYRARRSLLLGKGWRINIPYPVIFLPMELRAL